MYCRRLRFAFRLTQVATNLAAQPLTERAALANRPDGAFLPAGHSEVSALASFLFTLLAGGVTYAKVALARRLAGSCRTGLSAVLHHTRPRVPRGGLLPTTLLSLALHHGPVALPVAACLFSLYGMFACSVLRVAQAVASERARPLGADMYCLARQTLHIGCVLAGVCSLTTGIFFVTAGNRILCDQFSDHAAELAPAVPVLFWTMAFFSVIDGPVTVAFFASISDRAGLVPRAAILRPFITNMHNLPEGASRVFTA